MNFKETLEKHLDAIQKRNLKQFLETVCSDDAINVVLPNGVLIDNQTDFINFHKEWFSDHDWSINFEIVRSLETSEMAFVLILMEYHDRDEEGQSYDAANYLNLIFINKDGKWLLIHDQNTPIDEDDF